MTIAKVFLYAEIQASLPFRDINWRELNQSLLLAPGLKSKTWLSGINNSGIGGFYEFDSIENARAFVEGPLAAAAKRVDGNLSTKLFDGDVTAVANQNSIRLFTQKTRLHPINTVRRAVQSTILQTT